MFDELEKIAARPEPYEFYTARDLWTGEHTSARMLSFHLDGSVNASSRNADFIRRSVEWIVSRFQVRQGTKIADFGCGPGLYAHSLAGYGARVTGIDFSPRSIAYARQAATRDNLSIRYETADYLEFETKDQFDLVLMIMCDFCALSPSQRKTLLGRFYKALKPGGCVLLDVYSLAAFDQRREEALYQQNLLDGFWAPGKYHGFLNVFKYNAQKVVLEKYTIVEPQGTRTVYNWFQCFTPQELEKEFQEGGFALEELYADVAGTVFDPASTEFAAIAQKRA